MLRAEEVDVDDQYQRLSQVIIAQIFSNPQNIKVLQGIAAGQYSVMDMQGMIHKYVAEKGYLEGKAFNAERLEEKIASGKLKDEVIKNVIKQQKPEKLEKVSRNPQTANHGAQPRM
jgi:predicted metal-dependent phosphotriesterase family hydrolase